MLEDRLVHWMTGVCMTGKYTGDRIMQKTKSHLQNK